MTAALDTSMLRSAALTPFELNAIGVLVKTGGECAWYPNNVKPITRDGVQGMIDKGLVSLVLVNGTQWMRLTDHGRRVAEQLERMSAAPKLEVSSP